MKFLRVRVQKFILKKKYKRPDDGTDFVNVIHIYLVGLCVRLKCTPTPPPPSTSLLETSFADDNMRLTHTHIHLYNASVRHIRL